MAAATLFMSGRDCAGFIARSIASAVRQTHRNLHVLVVDDASTDDTYQVARLLLEAAFPGRHTLVRNAVPFGKARNAFAHMGKAPPSDFVAVLDADDELIDDGIVADMAAAYDDGLDVVWTNFATDAGTQGVNASLDPFRSPRVQSWRTSHFFSFRRTLFEAVPESYFKDDEGRWFLSACDFAIAFPVLDQTRRYRFLPRLAYRYTVTNPASHHNRSGAGPKVLSSPQQSANAQQVLAKPPLPCRRPLSGCPAALDESLSTLWEDVRGRLARIERGVELLVQARSRVPVDVLAAEGLSKEEGVPLHWLAGAGGWSTDLELLHHLRGVLDLYERPRVLEFGSGASSRILAKLVGNRGGRLVSVEHDPAWCERTGRGHREAGLDAFASVRLAPLVDADFLGLRTRFYDMSWLTPADRFDVVIVDGPPSEPGLLVRVSGLPAVAEHLAADFRLYLDDFEREDEKKVADIWQKVAPDLRFRTLEFHKAVCEVAPR